MPLHLNHIMIKMLRPGEEPRAPRKKLSRRQEQLIRKGLKGPQPVALKKTLKKVTSRDARRAGRISRGAGSDLEGYDFMAKRRCRRDNVVAVSYALSAAGLDPKVKAHAAVRGQVHRLMQKMADASADMQTNPAASPQESAAQQRALLEPLRQSIQIVHNRMGQEAAERFFQAYHTHGTAVAMMHTQLGREHRQERRGF